MAEVLDHPPVSVNGCEISAAAISAEVQNHPAPDADTAWEAATRALVFRQLLLDEADRLEIMSVGLVDAEGRKLADEDARIEALLEQEVRCPNADEATIQRFYERHADRFTSPTLVEAEHILFSASPDDGLAYGLATGDARMAIRALMTEPGRFSELALKHSACPSREQGGNLGQIGPGQTVKEFEDVLFDLGEGELHPEPVKTRFGVHVIRAGRRIVGEQIPLELVRDKIAQYLEEASWRRAVAQYLAILASQAKVEGIDIGGADGPLVQ
ncbi:peptidylprolyl isomerase [uncultured Sphingorhabdus sp.]|uniref:peptidylprolyl isomerase n=1 Tax=uncultured Sphingorhabdus sp. TaxID=1686106 RepID=UPI00260E2736|nr:peptidylprolyl isomerase [uncultured Sphingorhabdus sp.]HMS20812.1 peptidylprolyl isomerase [Sphingorhabdus sp.]